MDIFKSMNQTKVADFSVFKPKKKNPVATEEQKARIGVLKAKAKIDDQISVEDKVAKLFEAIGGELDAESE